MLNKIPDSVKIINDDENLDKNYEQQLKMHKSTIEKLNHWFRIITHPFILTAVLVVLGTTFCVFYVMSKSSDIQWVKSAADLLRTVLSYVATFVFSSVFTWFLGNYSKLKSDDIQLDL